MILLFEPWNLGDAIIAASVARLAPDRFILACNSRWHEILLLLSNNSVNLLSLDLPYVWRTEKKFFSLGDAASLGAKFRAVDLNNLEVISIRGDVRDLIAAHRIFNGAKFRFAGWLPFLARKISPFDLPFKHGLIKIRNRYRAWAEAVGIPFSMLECTYADRPEKADDASAVIHVGAQWQSKQYPHVAELAELLRNAGTRVEILAGPDDPLPPGVSEDIVQRPRWVELVAHLRGARHVVTNDSGPMHLSAYLGCQTFALSRCSNILEWLPPGAKAVSSPSAPLGYRPVPDYWSDRILPDWRSPTEVMAIIKSTDRELALTKKCFIDGIKLP